MKNKVVNTILGISAVASVSGGIYLGAVNADLQNELQTAKDELTAIQTELDENNAFLADYDGKVKELSALAEQLQAQLDELNTPTPSYTITPFEEPLTLITTEDTNFRNGPSTDYDITDPVAKDTELTIIGQVEDENGTAWYVVATDDEQTIETGVNDTDILEDGHQHKMISANLVTEKKAEEPATPAKPDKPGKTEPAKPSCDNSCNCNCDNSCDCNCDCDCDSGCNNELPPGAVCDLSCDLGDW